MAKVTERNVLLNVFIFCQKRVVFEFVLKGPWVISGFDCECLLFFDVGFHFLLFVTGQTCTALAQKGGEEGEELHSGDVGARWKEIHDRANGCDIFTLVEQCSYFGAEWRAGWAVV